MRINMLSKVKSTSERLDTSGGILSGPLYLNANPILPLEAATKNYVDLAANSINASNITTGTLNINRLPVFSGDVQNNQGSNLLKLVPSGVIPGIYTKYKVDQKGRVIEGSTLTNEDIPEFDWSKVTLDKPTTLAGYGITDGVLLAGDTVNGYVTLASNPTTAYQLATKDYVDSLVSTIPSALASGDTIKRPSAIVPNGFLRCNGEEVSKTTYSTLYNAIGDTFSITLQPGSGQPWHQQYFINNTQSSDITGWTTGTSLPGVLGISQAIVTKNRVYLLGGYTIEYVSTVYTAPINSDGTLGTWSTGTALPVALGASQAIVTKNRVYLLGGATGSSISTVYTAPINSDGTLGTWVTETVLPDALSYSQAIVTKNRVYLLGGYTGSVYVSTVYTAPINSDGTLGTWTTGTSLPGALAHSQAIVTKNRVYLLGGRVGNSHVSTVYTAPINSDGTLGTWTTGTSLPGLLSYSQAIVTKNRVYLLGGWDGDSSHISTVYTAPINSDGTLGNWTTGTDLPGLLSYSQPIVTKNRVYLLGGYIGNSVSTVYTAPINGGLNDYSSYYDGTPLPTDPTKFRLPDTTSIDINGIYTYIKI